MWNSQIISESRMEKGPLTTPSVIAKCLHCKSKKIILTQLRLPELHYIMWEYMHSLSLRVTFCYTQCFLRRAVAIESQVLACSVSGNYTTSLTSIRERCISWPPMIMECILQLIFSNLSFDHIAYTWSQAMHIMLSETWSC